MKELLQRFVALERALSQDRGPFTLFALFLREDAVDKWDLILAATWIEEDRKQALSDITSRIQATFAAGDLSLLSRVVFVELANPAVEAMNKAIRLEHGEAEVRDSNFFGLQIKHAYIITSKPVNIDEKVLA